MFYHLVFLNLQKSSQNFPSITNFNSSSTIIFIIFTVPYIYFSYFPYLIFFSFLSSHDFLFSV
ncbi:hypothetical protein CoNPh17_CDS0073 [Staphylococcus phage S-CoN_Ph17]|nr:hypothetical protein CoNPh17_CDS0073 [Staphylococcus phage S-CoN_Ph17]